MATKSDPDLIDDLLRQDEAELRAKKKRLRAFQTALDELRHASEAVATAGAALIAAGDVSRAEASKVFKLSKGERAAAFPARPRSESSVADSVNEPTHPVDDPSDESDEQHTDLGSVATPRLGRSRSGRTSR